MKDSSRTYREEGTAVADGLRGDHGRPTLLHLFLRRRRIKRIIRLIDRYSRAWD